MSRRNKLDDRSARHDGAYHRAKKEGFAARAGQRVRLPDGSDRFVVDEAMLLELTAQLGGRLADPLKTTNVQGLRAMTTWCVLKGDAI